jgi:hypothetical protein
MLFYVDNRARLTEAAEDFDYVGRMISWTQPVSGKFTPFALTGTYREIVPKTGKLSQFYSPIKLEFWFGPYWTTARLTINKKSYETRRRTDEFEDHTFRSLIRLALERYFLVRLGEGLHTAGTVELFEADYSYHLQDVWVSHDPLHGVTSINGIGYRQ